MKWIDQKDIFQKRFDDLAQENITGIITELNKKIGTYVSHGGVDPSKNISQNQQNQQNPEYKEIIKLTAQIDTIKSKYSALNDDINEFILTQSKNKSLAALLKENGEIQQEINKLEKIKDKMKVDVESAVARDELLRSRNTDVSRHKLFLLDRPIRKDTIPYLWVFAIFFIGIGLIIFKMGIPGIPSTGSFSEIIGMVLQLLTSKLVLGTLLVTALIVIIFLSLTVAGVFKK
jgi:hypothetical protein